MYVINEQTKIVNTWEDNEINRQRLASGKYGVIEYFGEIEYSNIPEYEGIMYAQGYAPMYTDQELIEIEKERISNLEISQEKFWNFMDPSTRNDAKIEIEKVSGLENKIYNSLENPTYKRDCLIIEILTGIYNLSDSELDLLFDS